jgi:FAD/FMN-containing dehydrogenase
MSSLTSQQQRAIEAIVTPDRVRFDPAERRRLSRDYGLMPAFLGPVNGKTVADAVVRPITEQEVVALAGLGRVEGLPLVPRGAGTGLYGGAVPADGGLVLDLTRLTGLLEVTGDVVTVNAGTTWADLKIMLARFGLSVRLYPTSASVSTVGGWVAQDGAGEGSHAFGWMHDNVAAIRLVGSEGYSHTLSGDDLDAAAGAEGTTGTITEVELYVRPATALAHVWLRLPDAASLTAALGYLTDCQLPIWSARFLNPAAARRLHRADSGVFLRLTHAVADEVEVAAGLHRMTKLADSEPLPAVMMQRHGVDGLVPLRQAYPHGAVAPAEVVVPTPRVAACLVELEQRLGGELAVEGTSVCGRDIVLRAFVAPEHPAYAAGLGFGLAWSVLTIAERHGGRGLSPGRYFGARAASILGRERVEFLRQARQWLDPVGLLNPGKLIFGNELLGQLVQVTGALGALSIRSGN